MGKGHLSQHFTPPIKKLKLAFKFGGSGDDRCILHPHAILRRIGCLLFQQRTESCYRHAHQSGPSLSRERHGAQPYLFQMFSQYFPLAAGPAGSTSIINGVGDLVNSSYTELYIGDPTFPFRLKGVANLSKLSNHDLGIRIGQMLNTYYLASLEPFLGAL